MHPQGVDDPTGQPVETWPLVIVKELVDNALDAAEEAGEAPQITVAVAVTDESIVVTDNGPGGAQGNALKTLVAMPYVLDGTIGRVEIAARGVNHLITFKVDPIQQVPVIAHVCEASRVKIGTRVTAHWPVSASSILAESRDRFLQIIDDFTWINPHLDLTLEWGNKLWETATNPAWQKWKPSDPTCPHWYDRARLERLIAAYVSHDRVRSRTVREFVSEFRGLSATAKQAAVLDALGLARAPLSSLCADGDFDKRKVAAVLAAMQQQTKPVKPKSLGLIGKEHLRNRMADAGVEMKSFDYSRAFDTTDDGLPCVVEFAFGWAPKATSRFDHRVNWSPGITNPFRQLGTYGQSLDTILAQQRADRNDPVILVLHVACPRVEYTDRGKSAIAIGGRDRDPDSASSRPDAARDRFLQEFAEDAQ